MALKTLKSKVQYRISRSKDNVFTPGDFLDLSGRDQVGRALRQLVAEEKLIRFGYGLYAKTRKSPYTGEMLPATGLPNLAYEALTNKLGITVLPSTGLRLYNEGKSTQVPTGRVIGVSEPVNREMYYNNQKVKYEHIN